MGATHVSAGRIGANRSWARRLNSYAVRHRRSLLLALGATLTGTLVSCLVPLVTKVVVDDVVVRPSRSLPLWIGLLLAAAAAGYLLAYLRRMHAGRLAADVQHDLRTDLFRSMTRLDGVRQDELSAGQLIGRATGDLNMVFGLVSTVPTAIGSASMFMASLLLMGALSPLLTLVALAMVPALWFVIRHSHTRLYPATWYAQSQAAAVADVVESSTAGIRVVKGFGQEQQEMARLTAAAKRLYAGRLRAVRFNARYGPGLQAVPALGQVGILAFGGWMAARGQITLGTFVAFSAYLAQLVAPIQMLASLLTMGQQAGAGIERVLELIDTCPTLTEGTEQLPGESALGIEFDHVTFGYDPDRPVLRDISLRIAPGETVAVVGSPGSGKSTLALLLSRFYDVSLGAVRIGGRDVRDIAFDSLRGAIGTVPEETFLFSGTVRDNIAYGRPGAGEEEIQDAARAAEAHRFISALPEGYGTVVGERGFSLSGGQRQRVALARAVLTDPRVLVLDDATSAVDAQVETGIHDALHEIMTGHTTLVIARRRSTLALADRVAVLDNGRLVDTGTHDELQERCARYREVLQNSDAGAETDGERPSPASAPAHPAASDPWRREQATTLRGARPGSSARAASDLLAQVAALPPADQTPDVDEAAAARGNEGKFGLRHLLHDFWFPLVLGLLLVVANALGSLLLPVAIRYGVEDGVQRLALGTVWAASFSALAIVLAQWAVQWGAVRVTGRTGERLLYALRVRVFAHLHRLGLDHYERESAGRTMTRMTTDVDSLSAFLQTGLLSSLVSLLTLVGVLVALFVAEVRLLLVVLAVLPVLGIATVVFRRKSAKAYSQARERIAAVNGTLQEHAAGTRLVQAFRREQASIRMFNEQSDAYRLARIRGQFLLAVYFPSIQFLSATVAALILAVGAVQVGNGTMTVGTLIAYLLYIDLFFAPVQQLSQLYDGYQQARVSLSRIHDFLEVPSTTPTPVSPHEVRALRGDLVFKDVHFRYRDGASVLSGIGLHIPQGQTVALVGETGAGKSTLMKLVARFYDPTQGAVLVDGTDIRDMDLTAFRQRLGVVPQEPYLFAGPVRDAIAYGRMDATDAEVEAAARDVGAHDSIAGLEGGYRHLIAEGGRNLSAGQRQLIALARAELVRPDILLLDEATAALDLATEALVNRATDRIATRRTTVIVAHRLSTAARADRVIVLDSGRVCEDGTHEELLALGGRYAGLWRAYEGHPAADPAVAPGRSSLDGKAPPSSSPSPSVYERSFP